MSSACSTSHRRSKSASDKNLETSYCLGKGYCTSQNLQSSRKPNGLEDQHQNSSNINNDDSTDHRASLENDLNELTSRGTTSQITKCRYLGDVAFLKMRDCYRWNRWELVRKVVTKPMAFQNSLMELVAKGSDETNDILGTCDWSLLEKVAIR
ncbi:hypothetical protein IEQ34_014963 [Dendrobium chrysotoxum]|uniref:Uncharacterized protein n=1 Tax=Dendrobium chrysotoxum TaxID=161865 RepID=A0AAV7GLK8_DENCH|nr:hypothetical protein IEQ34_014963 [Dendrobium chrysotoxum]